MLNATGTQWINVEGEDGLRDRPTFTVFLGESGARFLAEFITSSTAVGPRGLPVITPLVSAVTLPPLPMLRAPVHFVDDRYRKYGATRYSAPFFLRVPSQQEISPGLTSLAFAMSLNTRPWALLRGAVSPATYASDF